MERNQQPRASIRAINAPRRRFVAGFAVAWLLAALGLGAVFYALPSQRLAVVGIEQTRKMLSETSELLVGLLDAETGQRGYLLTGVAAYMKSYERGVSEAKERLAAVHGLVSNNPAQRQRLDALDALVSAKLSELANTVELASKGDWGAATAVVREGNGRQAMEAVRASLGAIVGDEERTLAQRRAQAQSAEHGSRMVLFALATGLLFLLAVSLYLVLTVRLRRQGNAERDAILSSIADGFVAFDTQWRYIYVNVAAEKLLEKTQAELLGKNHWDLFPAARGTLLEREYLTVMVGRTPLAFENFYAPWKRWFGMRAYPAPDGGITVYFQDITERKQTEAALLESEERFRALADNIPLLCWMADADGGIFWYNFRWYDYTGTTPEQMEGWGWQSVHHPDKLPVVLTAWKQSIADGTPFEMLFPLKAADGTFSPFLTRVLPIRDGQGRITRWFGTNTEVREIVEAREALAKSRIELERLVEQRTAALISEVEERRRAEESMRQGEKLQAIGQLTGGIAHDFNNMLQVVASGVMIMRMPTVSAERKDRILDGMAQAAKNAQDLTAQLLSFARQQSLKPETIDLSARLAAMCELLRHSLGSQMHVVTELEDDLWPVTVDPSQLETAVLNLAVNARDAMPNGGTLTIKSSRYCPQEKSEGDNKEFVCLTVSDTGEGMTAEVQARIFEPFFTTKPLGKGTGLGLAQVHGFIKQTGGDIIIESAPGRGTAVTLLLPRAAEGATVAVAGDEKAAAVAAIRPTGRTVLVVDDNANVAAFISTLLGELGYVTRQASSAAEALAVLASAEPVDAVFSDIVMPGDMDGTQLAEAIRRDFPSVAVVLATGYSEQLTKLGQHYDIEVVAKPYRIDDVTAALARALVAISPAANPVEAVLD